MLDSKEDLTNGTWILLACFYKSMQPNSTRHLRLFFFIIWIATTWKPMASFDAFRLPQIDFSRLELEKSSTDEWKAVRSQVMHALENYCSFEAVFDRVTLDLREAVFGKVFEDLFGLPLETKMRNCSDKLNHGYIGKPLSFTFESMAIDDALSLEGVQRFADLMWPNKENPGFCETVLEFAKLVTELEQMVRKMVLESFDLEKYYDSHINTTTYGLRLSEYAAVDDDRVRLEGHKDPNMTSIVCQHNVYGLEVRSKQGDWIDVSPTPHSFTVLLGDAFEAWSNGRLQAAPHRVIMKGNVTRYCTILGAQPKDGYMVEAQKELVDDEHPLLFKPYHYGDYLRFRFSPAGVSAKHVLTAFCGAKAKETEKT